MGLCFSKWLELEIELVAPILGGGKVNFSLASFHHFILYYESVATFAF